MNEELNVNLEKENSADALHNAIASLPVCHPETEVVTIPEEEKSNGSMKIVLGGLTILAAGVAGGVAWFKHRQNKNKRIAELEEELAKLKEDYSIFDSEPYPEIPEDERQVPVVEK